MWETLSQNTPYSNEYFSVKEACVLLPNGKQAEFKYINRKPGVLVIPLLTDTRVLMVHQYRYIIGIDSWELPSGGVNEGESLLAAAQRELLEETGYTASEILYLGKVYPSQGTSNGVLYVFLARGLKLALHIPDTEDKEYGIRFQEFDLPTIHDMIQKGEINCCSTISSLFQYALSQRK